MKYDYPEFCKDFGKRLRALREKMGLSQDETAKMLGLTRSAYTYYETGKSLPDLMSIRRLAEIFKVPLEVLMYPERHLY